MTDMNFNGNRPIYQKPEHLEQEVSVMSRVTERWKCQSRKLPYWYKIDFALTNGLDVKAFCEIKSTNYEFASFEKFGGYLLSQDKWNAAKSLCETTGLPFYLVVEDPSKTLWYFRTEVFDKLTLRYYGTYKRNDKQDTEPCVVIALDKFKQF
jgi:hypothetical protein